MDLKKAGELGGLFLIFGTSKMMQLTATKAVTSRLI